MFLWPRAAQLTPLRAKVRKTYFWRPSFPNFFANVSICFTEPHFYLKLLLWSCEGTFAICIRFLHFQGRENGVETPFFILFLEILQKGPRAPSGGPKCLFLYDLERSPERRGAAQMAKSDGRGVPRCENVKNTTNILMTFS